MGYWKECIAHINELNIVKGNRWLSPIFPLFSEALAQHKQLLAQLDRTAMVRRSLQ